MRFKRLTIVSDTALFRKEDGWYGFNAVVNEIECIEEMFDTIIWLGVLRKDKEHSPTLKKVVSQKVKIIPLGYVGGKGFFSKVKVIFYYPLLFFIVFRYVRNAEVIHTRLPSHPAFIAVILSFFFKNRIWWNKFAGSWDSSSLPFFYRVQKNLLLKAKHAKVTMNGFWNEQPEHCLSFENPCLSIEDIKRGKHISESKIFKPPFTFVFVGRLEEAKGMSKIIEALKSIDVTIIKSVHFIGAGKDIESYKNETIFLGDKVFFHGLLNLTEVHAVLEEAHFFLLPSKSEGFPKVIAEAACYGAIPVVSSVGSIAHYVNDENGFVWDDKGLKSYVDVLQKAVTCGDKELRGKSKNLLLLAEKFTFERYFVKLNQFVFGNNS